MGNRVDAPSKKERVVLSEILPYEVPLFFSNRHFYRFLVDEKVEWTNDEVVWKSGSDGVDAVVKLIFGKPHNEPVKRRAGRNYFAASRQGKGIIQYTIPYNFRVAKNLSESRTLSVCHPRDQIGVVDFYDKYKGQIVYFAGRSPLSIRKPARVSNHAYHDDLLHAELKKTWAHGVQQSREESESFRSYFAYDRFNNIYKFFESWSYQRLEKRYKHLLRLDISKCFDSIYTHSNAWAIYGKDAVKEHVRHRAMKTFPEVFHQVMQKLNYNETNGIVVGPEFSRLFAEIILQSIDLSLIRTLAKSGVVRGPHYEVQRYVDDYFIFFDRPADAVTIQRDLEAELSAYGLHLNKEKQSATLTPNITPISIAKSRISNDLGSSLGQRVVYPHAIAEEPALRAKQLITSYKTIIRESGVDVADVLNYSLSLVEQKVFELLKRFTTSAKSPTDVELFVRNLIEVIHFVFFVFSTSPKVNPTVKLCRIVNHVVEFVSHNEMTSDLRKSVFDAIYSETLEQLSKSHDSENIQVENLYLVTSLAALGRDYLLPLDDLLRLFSIERAVTGDLEFGIELDHFALMTLLSYVDNRTRYDSLRDALVKHIEQRVATLHADSTERLLLILDAVACPFVPLKIKMRLLLAAGIKPTRDREAVIALRPSWFTKWKNFDLGAELDLKRNQEVY